MVATFSSGILDQWQVPDYCPSLEEEGICKVAFELIFAFDEVISLGHKENVTVSDVKQYIEMESHEERLHKMIVQSKISDTKDIMKRKANEIDKSKVSISMKNVRLPIIHLLSFNICHRLKSSNLIRVILFRALCQDLIQTVLVILILPEALEVILVLDLLQWTSSHINQNVNITYYQFMALFF